MKVLIRLLCIALYSTGLAAQSGSDRLDAYFVQEFSEFNSALEPHVDQLNLCLEQMDQYEIDSIISESLDFPECDKSNAMSAEIYTLFIDIGPVGEAYDEWQQSFSSVDFEQGDFRSPSISSEGEALIRIYTIKFNQVQAHYERLGSQVSDIANRIRGGTIEPEELLSLQRLITEFSVHEIRSADALEGCRVEYNVAGRDSVYAPGSAVSISGSINLHYFADSKALVMSMSVVGKDFDLNAEQPPEFNIPYAYLRAGDSSTAGAEYVKYECDDAVGSFCSAWVDPIETIAGGIFGGDMQLIYQREIDGPEVAISLDPFLMDDQETPFTTWFECTLNLAELI